VIVNLEIKPFQWENVDECSPRNRNESKTYANQVLCKAKWVAFCDHASKLDHNELEKPFEEVNSKEHLVSEESL